MGMYHALVCPYHWLVCARSRLDHGTSTKDLYRTWHIVCDCSYDKLDGLYPQYDNKSWAQQSLKLHEGDKREYLYSEEELDQGRTHDNLWNAAQLQMVHDGKMHGFLRYGNPRLSHLASWSLQNVLGEEDFGVDTITCRGIGHCHQAQ